MGSSCPDRPRSKVLAAPLLALGLMLTLAACPIEMISPQKTATDLDEVEGGPEGELGLDASADGIGDATNDGRVDFNWPDARVDFNWPDARADAAHDASTDGLLDASTDVLPDASTDSFLDAPPEDGSAEALMEAGGDATAADVTADLLSADWGASWQILLQLRTTSLAPDPFQPEVVKSGAPLRWDLGDGAIVDTNVVDHLYSAPGEKIVRVSSSDGPQGVTSFVCSKGALVGSIPSALGGLSSLTRIALDENELTGAIPIELGQLSELTWLSLSGNSLSGSIPSELGKLAKLENLHLYQNQLVGTIPLTLGLLSELRNLHLFGNELVGAIPSTLSLASKLQAVYLYDNQLTGYQAGAFSGWTTIRIIRLEQNQLSQAAVDAIIADLYLDRDLHTFSGTKRLDLGGGNAAPSATGRVQVETLRADYGWEITCTDC